MASICARCSSCFFYIFLVKKYIAMNAANRTRAITNRTIVNVFIYNIPPESFQDTIQCIGMDIIVTLFKAKCKRFPVWSGGFPGMLMTAEYIEKTGGTGRLPGKREEDTMELLTALGTGEGAFEPFERLIRYNEHAAGAELTCRNAVEIFTDGRGLYEDLAGAIANAGEYIHILSYIIRRDEVFEALEEML